MTPRFQVWELLAGRVAFISPECVTLMEACRRLPVGEPAVIARDGVVIREGDDVTTSRRALFDDVIARRWMRVATGSGKPQCSRVGCVAPQAEAPKGCPVVARPFCWACRHTLLAVGTSGVNLADLAAAMRDAPPTRGRPAGVSPRARTHRETALLATWQASTLARHQQHVAIVPDIIDAGVAMGLPRDGVYPRVSEVANAPLRWLDLVEVGAYRVTERGREARAAILRRDARLAQGVTT